MSPTGWSHDWRPNTTNSKTNIDLDRERIACVFGLGGGDLHESHADFPDEWNGRIAYWYDGPPEYATELKDANLVECPACDSTGLEEDEDSGDCDGRRLEDREVRTAILDVMFGFPEPPPGWERIASFTSSGEAECWWCGSGTGNEDQREECALCEGDGIVYLGEGWCEVVYRRTPTRPSGC